MINICVGSCILSLHEINRDDGIYNQCHVLISSTPNFKTVKELQDSKFIYFLLHFPFQCCLMKWNSNLALYIVVYLIYLPFIHMTLFILFFNCQLQGMSEHLVYWAFLSPFNYSELLATVLYILVNVFVLSICELFSSVMSRASDFIIIIMNCHKILTKPFIFLNLKLLV